MLFTVLLTRVRYTSKHVLGAGVCVVGLGLLVLSDLLVHRVENQSSNVALGDGLVLISCLFYAMSNLSQELLVKQHQRTEFLAMLGVCGSVVSGVQMLILEREQLQQVPWHDPVTIAYLLCFNLCLLLLYLTTPWLLTHSSAVFMNLSMLSSDFWSIIVAVFVFHSRLHVLYFVAFAVILVGLALYHLAELRLSWPQIRQHLAAMFGCRGRERGSWVHGVDATEQAQGEGEQGEQQVQRSRSRASSSEA